MSELCDNCKELQRQAVAENLRGFMVCSSCNARRVSEDSDGKRMLIRDIGNCARCGEEHVALIATRFERPFAPPEAYPLVWTHWASCPTNGEPILVIQTQPVLADGEP